MHIDTVGGLVKISAITIAAVGVATASFFQSAATSIGIAAIGVAIGIAMVTLLGALLAAFRSPRVAAHATPVEAFVASPEPSDAPQV